MSTIFLSFKKQCNFVAVFETSERTHHRTSRPAGRPHIPRGKFVSSFTVCASERWLKPRTSLLNRVIWRIHP